MARRKSTQHLLETDPLWYKRAIVYELHVRSFRDSNGDGIGDFAGLTQTLGYLNDLGVTAIWLLPFYPSPLKDDGYDIADYSAIHPNYGTLADFKAFLREAHRRGLRVITELVLNHTSDQHPWFQLSRRAPPGSRWRDYYVWSRTTEKYRDARVIFKDFESSNWSWDPVAGSYYWHRFYSHQPDLNYDNPEVHREIFKIVDFWLDLGVDGLRLDAVPYLCEREGTNCENLPETHAFLRKLRQHVDAKYTDRMLLAEANQWPEDAAAYFGGGRGDECHMAFHFPVMPRLFMALRMEDRVPIVDILEQTPSIPESSQWALFLRNHDELTLEMVTDEERDAMYQYYAKDRRARINLGIRRRLAPLVGNDRRRLEILHALLVSLPGTPVLYYGDEIGMGDNIFLGDRNGIRTPMQWSAERNAGFSEANPQSLFLPVVVDPEYHYESTNVDTQQRNPHSLLWWVRRLLAIRKRSGALGNGDIEFLSPSNRKILAFLRTHGEERMLVVANLSRFVQPVELDLSAHAQSVPVELFGRTRFPVIEEKPYGLTLGPHSFYWFSLEPRFQAAAPGVPSRRVEGSFPALQLSVPWEALPSSRKDGQALAGALPAYLRRCRWFGGKAKEVKGTEFLDMIPVRLDSGRIYVAILKVDYVQGDAESYLIPLAFAPGRAAAAVLLDRPNLVIARAKVGGGEEGVIHDAIGCSAFCRFLLGLVTSRRRTNGGLGWLTSSRTSALKRIAGGEASELDPVLAGSEQSNSAVVYGDRLILKLFRRLEPGVNPDLELGRYLTSRRFPNAPAVAGAIEYATKDGEPTTLGVLHEYIRESKDAWTYTKEALGRFYERVLSLPPEQRAAPLHGGSLRKRTEEELPEHSARLLGDYAESARLLGHRTAELHRFLAHDGNGKDLSPELMTPHDQRSLFQSMRALAARNFRLLRDGLGSLPEEVRELATRVADLEPECLRRFHALRERSIRATRIRCHGDLHLGQVLSTGKDFLFIDFEGEPERALSERRIKRSALKDVSGMLRSFQYAAHAALHQQVEHGNVAPTSLPEMVPWANYWQSWAGTAYLKAYLKATLDGGSPLADREGLWFLLDCFVLEKAIYEIGYELNNRRAWLRIPLVGILQILERE